MVEHVDRFGMRLSRLGLGSVQLGMHYGVANVAGIPSARERRGILETARDAGVNMIDTAASYGRAEEFLGEILGEPEFAGRFVVFTKVSHFVGETIESPEKLRALVRRSVEQSLVRLKLDRLPFVLFHVPKHLTLHRAAAVKEIVRLREQGLIAHYGASFYTCQQAQAAFDAGVDVVQVPLNIIDFHLDECDFWNEARRRGILVCIRSAYLQGLLFMNDSDVPAYLAETLPTLRRLRALAADAGISLKHLALKFVYDHPGVDIVVTGADNADQLRETAAILQLPSLPPDITDRLRAIAADFPEWARDLREWDKRRPR